MPESTVKKKHHSIAYHSKNRKAVALETARIAKEASETNLSDLLTKLMSARKRECLFD